MSFEAQNWAKRARTGSPGAKLVLIILATYTDERGSCHPNLATLVEACEISRNTVRARLDELVAAGFVFRRADRMRENGQGQTSNQYVLLCDEVARAYAQSLGWVPGERLAPVAPEKRRGKSQPASDPRQIAFDLVGGFTPPAEISGDALVSNLLDGGQAAGWTPPVQAVGRPESPSKPSGEPPPHPPASNRGAALGVGAQNMPEEDRGELREQDLWPAFLGAFPPDVLDRRVPAREAWNRLTAAERAAAVKYAPRYGAETEERGRKRVGMDRWLREKGWEPFVEIEARRRAANLVPLFEQEWIREGSDEAKAWAAAQGVKSLFTFESPQHRGRGCYKPTRWPPSGKVRGETLVEENATKHDAPSGTSDPAAGVAKRPEGPV